MAPQLSVIIPCRESEADTLLQKSVEGLRSFKEVELIFVGLDEAASRAGRLNLGVERARSELILLHHPRSHIDREGIRYLLTQSGQRFWGAFSHVFDVRHPLLMFTSWYSNTVRGRRRHIFYLDHCVFMHKALYRPLPDVEIFEDTLLCHHLKRQMAPVLLQYKSTTSAVRFLQNGIYWHALHNQLLKIGFYLRLSDRALNDAYEKKVQLNRPSK